MPTSDLPRSPGHPFYSRLNRALESEGFDRFVESRCRRFYAAVLGRPSLAPGRYFRLLLVGYFEGLDSERGMAWRAADSLGVRSFLGLGLEERAPEHSTISRTRRLIDLETHRDVFTWIQERLAQTGLLSGKTIAIDATTLEANAAMRSIVRRDTGETYQEFLKRLAKASGIRTPSRQALARLDSAAQEERLERGMEESGGSGREDRQNEGWSYPSGPQNRAGRGPDDGGDRVGDGPGREPGRHEHAGQDAQGRRDSDRARSEADPCLPSRRPAGSGWRQGLPLHCGSPGVGRCGAACVHIRTRPWSSAMAGRHREPWPGVREPSAKRRGTRSASAPPPRRTGGATLRSISTEPAA